MGKQERYVELHIRCPECEAQMEIKHINIDTKGQIFNLFCYCPLCDTWADADLDIRDYIHLTDISLN